MRGDDEQSGHLFSYVSPEHRVPADHPLRAIRAMTDEALDRLSLRFARLYAATGRPSIPPEHLLRALLLQVPENEESHARSTNDAPYGVRDQPADQKAHRGSLRLDEDGRRAAQTPTSRRRASELAISNWRPPLITSSECGRWRRPRDPHRLTINEARA